MLRSYPVVIVLSLLSLARAGVPDARLANLSSRTVVGAGSNVLVSGFVIKGDAPKDIIIRAVGPTLANFGITGELSRPRLDLYDAQHALLGSNDQWAAGLRDVFAQVGALPLTDGSFDAAMRVTLAPGLYNTEISGVDGAKGVVLVELYEIDATSRLVNLSTRAQVQTGDGILLSGFVVAGSGPRRFLIRALGPALQKLGLDGALANPTLSVSNSQGTVFATSDNWTEGGLDAEIKAVSQQVGATPLADGSKDSAVVASLDPGVYTVRVSGVADATGVALLEIYDIPLDPAVQPYAPASLSWGAADVSARLGPTFEELNPAAIDDRPTHDKRESKAADGYFIRVNPYELGAAPGPDTNYWSDSGQVAYIPDDPTNDPGLDRIQTFAYYNQVFATSPRLDWASGKPHPDAQTRDSNYIKINGVAPSQPIGMVRGYGMQQNEELVIYRDGLLGVAGTQTSRAGSERPYPGFKFPPNKLPRAIAVTTSNEFALVTVWDTDRHQGQLAVIALEGKYLKFHTWPYMAMPNQGSFSDFKLLGYVDLPMASPDLVAAASNGLWTGPSSTGDRVLSQIVLSAESDRKLAYDGSWQTVVAKGGYAIVASSSEDTVAILDLTPLFSYVRDSYLKSDDDFQRTTTSRGPAATDFPQTFAVLPTVAPRVVWSSTITKPSAVLAGLKIDHWSADVYKAYVASQDGTVHIIDTSSLMGRSPKDTKGPLQEIGNVFVGRNPVSMAFARYGEGGLPLIPLDAKGVQRSPDPLNNMFYVACRGERDVAAVVTWQGNGQVYRRIRDSRMGDPVAVSVAVRGNIVSVADFAGKKILSFRIGTLNDTRNGFVYPPLGDGTDQYEFCGELPFAGSPFLLNSTNVN
jgi:hypothetical protein